MKAVVDSVRGHRECTLEDRLVGRVSKDALGMLGTWAYVRVWAKDAEGLGEQPRCGTVGVAAVVAVAADGIHSGSHCC